MEAFLSHVCLPSMAEEGQKILERESTANKIEQAISKLPHHKAPGEDGFPSEYYKWSGGEVPVLLSTAFKEAEE